MRDLFDAGFIVIKLKLFNPFLVNSSTVPMILLRAVSRFPKMIGADRAYTAVLRVYVRAIF